MSPPRCSSKWTSECGTIHFSIRSSQAEAGKSRAFSVTSLMSQALFFM
jgi:hypothetical protein